MWEESWQDTLPCCGAVRGIGVAAGARQGSRVVGEVAWLGKVCCAQQHPGLGDGWPLRVSCPPLGGTGSPAMVSRSPPATQPGLPPHPSRGRTVVPTAPLDGEQGTEGPVNCTPALFHWELACHLGAGVTWELALHTCYARSLRLTHWPGHARSHCVACVSLGIGAPCVSWWGSARCMRPAESQCAARLAGSWCIMYVAPGVAALRVSC